MKTEMNIGNAPLSFNQKEIDDIKNSDEFLQWICSRRSVRKFSSESIPKSLIENAILSASSAPSGANSQPWFFAIIESQGIKDQIRLAAEAVEWDFYNRKAPETWLKDLAPLGTNHSKPYLTEAPYTIAIFSRHFPNAQTSEDAPKSYYPIESTGIAVGFLLAALHKAGLGTLTHTPRPMGFLNRILGLDSTYKPYLMVITGKKHTETKFPHL